jgi:hypothetical protein
VTPLSCEWPTPIEGEAPLPIGGDHPLLTYKGCRRVSAMPSPLRQHTWLPMSLLATHTRDLAASSDHRLGRIGARLDCGLPEQNNKLKIGVVLAFWLSTMAQQKTREPGRSSGFFSCGEDPPEPGAAERSRRACSSGRTRPCAASFDSPGAAARPSASPAPRKLGTVCQTGPY